MPYHYKLYKNGRDCNKKEYTRCELNRMGTFLLRDICVKEKIMTRMAGLEAQRLTREELIELLYRYRGKKQEALEDAFFEDAILLITQLLPKAFLAAEPFEVPSKIELIQGISTTKADAITVWHGFSGENFCGILLDQAGAGMAVFEVQDNKLIFSANRISKNLKTGVYYDWSMILFDAPSTQKIISIYNEQKIDLMAARGLFYVQTVVPIFLYSEPEQADRPLFLDFGTSNTVAATIDETGTIRKVNFKQVCDICNYCGSCWMCPSIAVAECCEEGSISFCFGYEALDYLKWNGYYHSATILYNLKNYLFEERILEVSDINGMVASVSSNWILREFLLFIIQRAKTVYQKKYLEIFILAPEKRSKLALQQLRILLKEYQVELVTSESVSLIYQGIVEQVETLSDRGSFFELVFHCGGGTSSFIQCKYEVRNTDIAYRVSLEEHYISGDSGLGGNDFTYLILQYLKIRIVLFLQHKEALIFDEYFLDPYFYVDEFGGIKEVYQHFIERYQRAEAILPTKFDPSQQHKLLNKQNFCRLWFLAEQIKILFFSNRMKSSITLPQGLEEYCAVNIWEEGEQKEIRFSFSVDKEEIETLLSPKIYWMVKNFVEPLCDEDGILPAYRIKFTGLSCNISVFRDALREFTVGRKARKRQAPNLLKLKALDGAIMQDQLQKKGFAIPEIQVKSPGIPYLLMAHSYDGKRKKLILGENHASNIYGYVSRHIATEKVVFEVCDYSEHVIRTREIILNVKQFYVTDYKTLFEEYPFLQTEQGNMDAIQEDEVRLFVYKEENWDFCVLPLARNKGQLYTSAIRKFLFEDSSTDYFVGSY